MDSNFLTGIWKEIHYFFNYVIYSFLLQFVKIVKHVEINKNKIVKVHTRTKTWQQEVGFRDLKRKV